MRLRERVDKCAALALVIGNDVEDARPSSEFFDELLYPLVLLQPFPCLNDTFGMLGKRLGEEKVVGRDQIFRFVRVIHRKIRDGLLLPLSFLLALHRPLGGASKIHFHTSDITLAELSAKRRIFVGHCKYHRAVFTVEAGREHF